MSPCWRSIPLLAAILLVPGASLALQAAQQADPWAELPLEPERSRTAQKETGEPSFFAVPIRTELQRQLIAHGKQVQAMVVLNGFGTIGKRGVDRMRALDILALRRALAAIKTGDPNASVVFVIGFLGASPPDMQQTLSDEQKRLTQECGDLAKEAKLRVVQISGAFIGTPGAWPKAADAAKAIDPTKETAAEAAVGDADVRVFPVRTKVTELLTDWSQGGNPTGADCVVYLKKPIDPCNNPLIGAELEAHISDAIKKLNLPRKNRIDYHLVVVTPNHAAWQRAHDAIMNRFVGKEADQLTARLGFKSNSVTW
jgi:hypothetical protein